MNQRKSRRRMSRRKSRRRVARRSRRLKSRRKSRRTSRRKSRTSRRKSRRKSRRRSRSRTSRRKSRRRSRRRSMRKSRRRSKRRKSRRRSKRRRSKRRKSRRKRSRSKFGFWGSNKPHYVCVVNKEGGHRCNKYPNRAACEVYGAKCTSSQSQCMSRCNAYAKKRIKTMPGYKCDPLKNHCLKYSTIPKCMQSINSAEENAGIRCTSSLDNCKTGCDNLSARMKGVSGPAISNKAVIQRHQVKQAHKRTLAQMSRQQAAIQQMRQRQGVIANRPRPVAHQVVAPQPIQTVPSGARQGGGYVLGGSGGESRLLSGGIPGAPSVWYKDNSRTCKPIVANSNRSRELQKQRYRLYATKTLCESRR